MPTCLAGLLASAADLPGRFPGSACWSWGLRQRDVLRGRLEAKMYLLEMGAEKKVRPQQVVCYRTEG